LTKADTRKVLILVENLPVPLDRRVWLEATTLRAAGYEVSVIGPMAQNWTAPYEEIEGVHIYRYPTGADAYSGFLEFAREWSSAVWHMLRLSKIVRRERGFDVIQGCNPPDLLFLVAWRWRLAGVRYIFDHHDVCPELFEAKFNKRGLQWQMLRLFERLNFASARVVMSTNESFRKIAVTRGGMAPEDVFVVRSAPRTETFLPNREAAPMDGITRLGYVGVIGQQEGMDLLVAAADHLIRDLGHEAVHFEIVGFGPERATVEADVAARQLEAYFTFHGGLYGDDLLAVLNRCDIGVSPDPKNTMNDICTMNKIMEYMTLEMPVVQFDLTEGRASAGDAALYAMPNDAKDFGRKIGQLIDDKSLGRQMGERGRKRVLDTLSWDHSTAHLLAAYDRAFDKSPLQTKRLGGASGPVGRPAGRESA